MTEQAYTHISRREIVNTLAVRLGYEVNTDATNQGLLHLREIVRAAHLRAYEQCSWVHAQRAIMFQTNTEQGDIGFPAGCGPGSILQLSIWLNREDSLVRPWHGLVPPNVFVPLNRRNIKLEYDSDPLVDEGGEEIEKVKGIPKVYDVRDRILIRPITDKQYYMKLLFTYAPDLVSDDDRTIIDSELVIQYAMEEHLRYENETAQANEMLQRAERRLRHLRAQQATDQIIPYLDGVNMRLSPDEEAMLADPRDIPGFDFGAINPTPNWTGAGIVTNPNIGSP